MKINPRWYYHEKQSGVDYLDPKIVKEYDVEHQKFRNFEEEAKDIVQNLEITPDDIVLDFGCGTGEISLNMAKYCKKVVCVDISREMLDILEKKAQKQSIINIETHCAGFLTYEDYKINSIDKIYSIFSLHHLPDFWKSIALLNMAKILNPNGKLYIFDVIFTFDPKEHQKVLDKMIKDMRNFAGDIMADETEMHIREEFSTYDWIMEGLLKKAGFSIDSKKLVQENFVGYTCSKS